VDARKAERSGRLDGVTATVMWTWWRVERRWAKSRSGRRWPIGGNGTTSTCGRREDAVPVDMA
jgi:hypothetical protein